MWPRSRQLWYALPLRVKLTLLYVGLLCLLVSGLSIWIYLDTQHFLIQNTALRIRAQAKPVIERWLYASEPGQPSLTAPLHPSSEERVRAIAEALATDLTSRDTVALVLDTQGHILANGRRLPEEPEAPPPDPARVAEALAGNNEVTYTTTYRGVPTLTLLIPLRVLPGDPHIIGVVQMSTPLNPVMDVAKRQQFTLVLAGIIVLFLGSGLGLWLTGQTLRPLNEIVNACRRITEGDLSQRVSGEERGDEIGRLARAFNTMIAQLEQVLRAQQRFIANAAHELRTPLTAIQGSLEVLLRGAQDDPAAVSRLAQAMYREVTRMNRLAEQLLDLARLESPFTVQRQPVPLNTFFTSIAPQARLLMGDGTFTLEQGPPVTLHTDPDMLTQIIFDLIINAVQHNEPGIEVRVGWRVENERVCLWVEDNGQGISAHDLPHIFEPFYRGDRSRSRRQGGTGLGLALVKAMVDALGGEITVSSRERAGTRFEICFPYSSTP